MVSSHEMKQQCHFEQLFIWVIAKYIWQLQITLSILLLLCRNGLTLTYIHIHLVCGMRTRLFKYIIHLYYCL